MDPISIGLGLLSIGSSIFGGITGADTSKRQAELQTQYANDMYQQDLKVNAIRRQAMELSASRQQMEIMRNMQRARALALNNATNQGAQFGTGLQGGYGQISGQSNVNALGVQQNLMQGRDMFDLNEQTGQIKYNYQSQLAALGSEAATNQGLASMGMAIGSLGNVGLFKGLGSSFTGSTGNTTPQTYGSFLRMIGSNGIY